jgi:hypothetical protein
MWSEGTIIKYSVYQLRNCHYLAHDCTVIGMSYEKTNAQGAKVTWLLENDPEFELTQSMADPVY